MKSTVFSVPFCVKLILSPFLLINHCFLTAFDGDSEISGANFFGGNIYIFVGFIVDTICDLFVVGFDGNFYVIFKFCGGYNSKRFVLWNKLQYQA